MDDDFVELTPEALALRFPTDNLRRPEVGIGHNLPPLPEILKEETEALAKRRDELHGAVGRVPETIPDEATSGRVSDLIKLIIKCQQQAKADHKARKEPFLTAGRQVDAAYSAITEPLDRDKKLLDDRQTLYQRQKAEAERRAREAEARRLAEEAERQRRAAEAAAAALETEDDLEAAIAAEERAQQLAADTAQHERAAAAPVAELSRTRGEYGSVSSLTTFWDFRDIDRSTIDIEALRPYLPLDAIEKAVRQFIKSGGRKLAGCEIYENTRSRTR